MTAVVGRFVLSSGVSSEGRPAVAMVGGGGAIRCHMGCFRTAFSRIQLLRGLMTHLLLLHTVGVTGKASAPLLALHVFPARITVMPLAYVLLLPFPTRLAVSTPPPRRPAAPWGIVSTLLPRRGGRR